MSATTIYLAIIIYIYYTWILRQHYEIHFNSASIDVPYSRVHPDIASYSFIQRRPSKIDTLHLEVLNLQWHLFVIMMVHLGRSTPCNQLTMVPVKVTYVMRAKKSQEQRKMNAFEASISRGIFVPFWIFDIFDNLI